MIRAHLLATVLLFLAVPGFAQSNTGSGTIDDPKINTIILFGDDKCPESTDEQINVCAIVVEADRYRIPAALRGDLKDPRKEAWTNRVLAYEYIGRGGALSCSPSGATGYTGCGAIEINGAYAAQSEDPGLAFGKMIAEERRKRLAGIDAEAEEVEKRVVAFEKDRTAREARLASEPLPDEVDAALPEPK